MDEKFGNTQIPNPGDLDEIWRDEGGGVAEWDE
jgi:hypothetical protein